MQSFDTSRQATGDSSTFDTVDVAIVGAGFSGVACAIACSNRLPATKRIALIGAQPPGRGAAYGATSPRLLMNGPARAMSALADDEMNLVKRAHVTEHALIPRRDYSIYLQGLLDDALVRHPGITVHRDEIVDIAGDGDRLTLRGAQGATWHARSVVLALGNSAPSSSFLPTALCEYRGFIADPWSTETFPDGDVLCVGTGLTAMDVVALADRPGTSVLHLVSRHGRLPEIEDPYAHAFDPARLSLDPSFAPRSHGMSKRAATGATSLKRCARFPKRFGRAGICASVVVFCDTSHRFLDRFAIAFHRKPSRHSRECAAPGESSCIEGTSAARVYSTMGRSPSRSPTASPGAPWPFRARSTAPAPTTT